MTEQISLLDNQLVDMRFLTKLTGLTDKWFYKLIKDGDFPKPVKLGRSSRWLKSEVENWLQERINQSRKYHHSDRPPGKKITIRLVRRFSAVCH